MDQFVERSCSVSYWKEFWECFGNGDECVNIIGFHSRVMDRLDEVKK